MTVTRQDFESIGTALAESAVMLDIEPKSDEWYQLIGPTSDRLYELNKNFDTDKFYKYVRSEMNRVR